MVSALLWKIKGSSRNFSYDFFRKSYPKSFSYSYEDSFINFSSGSFGIPPEGFCWSSYWDSYRNLYWYFPKNLPSIYSEDNFYIFFMEKYIQKHFQGISTEIPSKIFQDFFWIFQTFICAFFQIFRIIFS